MDYSNLFLIILKKNNIEVGLFNFKGFTPIRLA